MTLTDRQAIDLEMEFLQQDLGRLPSATPAAAAKRELTRALYERATADEGVSPRPLIPGAHAAIQDTVRAVVAALDKLVTAWEASTVVSKGQPQIVDGVRTAASFIAEAAERAGLTVPVQPTRQQPGVPTTCAACGGRRWVDDENWFSEHEGERARGRVPGAGRIPCGSCNEGGWDEDDEPPAPAAVWAPSDGGRTPSMFGGI